MKYDEGNQYQWFVKLEHKLQLRYKRKLYCWISQRTSQRYAQLPWHKYIIFNKWINNFVSEIDVKLKVIGRRWKMNTNICRLKLITSKNMSFSSGFTNLPININWKLNTEQFYQLSPAMLLASKHGFVRNYLRSQTLVFKKFFSLNVVPYLYYFHYKILLIVKICFQFIKRISIMIKNVTKLRNYHLAIYCYSNIRTRVHAHPHTKKLKMEILSEGGAAICLAWRHEFYYCLRCNDFSVLYTTWLTFIHFPLFYYC